jgi:hypothetical protein
MTIAVQEGPNRTLYPIGADMPSLRGVEGARGSPGASSWVFGSARRSDRPKRRTVALRASVGSTEAPKDVVARVGRIDRSHFGPICFGVVGPKRTTAPRPSLTKLCKLLSQG